MAARSNDKEVLVVIGSGGMGLAIARRIGAGHAIVLADIDKSRLDAAADALSRDGNQVLTREVDVTSRSSVAALAEAATAAGRVTAVVHTAGLSPQQASADRVLAVDLLGVALVLDEFGRIIAPGGAGVVIASMAGHMYPALDPQLQHQLANTPADDLLSLDACTSITDSRLAYPFAKRANQIRVAAAAITWGGRGARINCVSPGVISTEMGRLELSGESGPLMQAMVDNAGLRRIGTPDDIAAATEFLLGHSASFITGTDLLVDGGVIAGIHTGTVELGSVAK
ncbi:SDR family oxidoreductase [Mycobacterium noviomagense]|uniref:Short-chain dehydrogenase n=1 Tax=Mycobacterium noviomagense TaxID=459858 RepID=A0A7I7PAT0_9MYCO|nr:SDR family oxidoreductase [Mycobacterium noviomagense]ORB15208.1 short-chain dehydrogenase [Mycobacterium noviomagense]BBY05707.1 short-chain dehydrogenase/reductas [Mycobacterium noviomagense]